MRKILLVALTAAAMVSCSENEGFENESTMNRIKFGTVVKTGTKTLVATTENFSKFTVSAYKTTDDMGGTVQLNTGFMDDIAIFCYLTGANFGYYYCCRLSEIRVCGEGG